MGRYAIIIVGALVLAIITYSSSLQNSVFSSSNRTVESFERNQAHNIAQGAAMLAISIIRDDPNTALIPARNQTVHFPSEGQFNTWDEMHGNYNIRLVNIGDSLLTITSRGVYDKTPYEVTLGLLMSAGGIWKSSIITQAIHAENIVDIGNGSVYGDISTNAGANSIKTNNNAEITGNVFYYDENENGPVSSINGKIGGEVYRMNDKVDFERPVFPEFPTGRLPWGNNQIPDNADEMERYVFDNFNTNNTTIRTNDNNREIHVRNLDLSDGLAIEGEGTVSIYVEGSINIGSKNAHESVLPSNLVIYYKGSNEISLSGNRSFTGSIFASQASVKISGNPTFNGHIITYGSEVSLNGSPNNSALVFAPNATVTLNGSAGTFRGAIVADKFEMNGRPNVTFDEDFASTMPDFNTKSEANFELSYWN